MSIPKAAAPTPDGSIASTPPRPPEWRPRWPAWARMEQRNLSNAKAIGAGVFEYRIDAGPGYRVYFGRDGDTLIILLGGGTKTRQQQAIEAARNLWREYKRRKRREV